MGRADELKERLERYCEQPVTDLFRFSGGASRETWSFTLEDGRRLVLRLDPPGAPSKNRDAEIDLLRRAHSAGVPVPQVVWAPDDLEAFGATGYVMEHIDGETIARKIIRDDEYVTARSRFAAQCGEIAARIHSIDTDVAGLDVPDGKPTELILDQYAALLDAFGEPHPAFELAMRWLRKRIPSAARTTVVHGDFRIGNFIIDTDGVRSVLDWELVHLGDPWEDLAWVCTRSWRFGGEGEVGGVGDRKDLYDAYERTSGMPVDRDAVHWWEVMSSVKWGVMTIGQAFTHLSGAVPSLELAAIGRRTVETEYDVLDLIGA